MSDKQAGDPWEEACSPPEFKVEPSTDHPWVLVQIGHQCFHVRFRGAKSRQDVLWYAEQFRTALNKLKG